MSENTQLLAIDDDKLLVNSSRFTPEDRVKINEIQNQITATNVLDFGTEVQTDVSNTADQILKEVNGFDLGDNSANLATIVTEMEQLDPGKITAKKTGILGKLFNRAKNELLDMKNQYQTIAAQTNNIAGVLKTQHDRLLRDTDTLQTLSEQLRDMADNLDYYIAATELELNDVVKNKLPELEARQDDWAMQDLYDLQDYANQLSDRIMAFKASKELAITQTAGIRMQRKLINNKVNDLKMTIAHDVPALKINIAATITMLSLEKAVMMDEMTRDMAGQSTVATAKKLQELTQKIDDSRAKGIVDVSLINESRKIMIETMKESIAKNSEITRQRKEAELIIDQSMETYDNLMQKQRQLLSKPYGDASEDKA